MNFRRSSVSLFLCSSQHLEGVNNPSSHCFYFLIVKVSRGHVTSTLCLCSRCWLATAPHLHNSTWYFKWMFETLWSFHLPPWGQTQSATTSSATGLSQHPVMAHFTHASLRRASIFNNTWILRFWPQALFTFTKEALSKCTGGFKSRHVPCIQPHVSHAYFIGTKK